MLNPYAIAGLAVTFVALAGASVAMYYRNEAAVASLEGARADVDRLTSQVEAMESRLFHTNQALAQRETETRTLRREYESTAAAIRMASDDDCFARHPLPLPVVRMFLAPGADGDGNRVAP